MLCDLIRSLNFTPEVVRRETCPNYFGEIHLIENKYIDFCQERL